MKKKLLILFVFSFLLWNTEAKAENNTTNEEKKFNASLSLGYPKGLGLHLNYKTGNKSSLGASLSSSFFLSDFSIYKRFYLWDFNFSETKENEFNKIKIYSQTGANVDLLLGWALVFGVGLSQSIGAEYTNPDGFTVNLNGGVGVGYPLYSSWSSPYYKVFVTPDINLAFGKNF